MIAALNVTMSMCVKASVSLQWLTFGHLVQSKGAVTFKYNSLTPPHGTMGLDSRRLCLPVGQSGFPTAPCNNKQSKSGVILLKQYVFLFSIEVTNFMQIWKLTLKQWSGPFFYPPDACWCVQVIGRDVAHAKSLASGLSCIKAFGLASGKQSPFEVKIV